MNYLISVIFIAVAIQFGELWMGLGATMILIIASRDIKASFLLIVSFGVFYYINGIGIKEYWLFAVLGLVALGYLIGLEGKNEAAGADPYAGLLGGGGLGGMG